MKIENIAVKPYSIIAMVGPSGSGKSYWVNKVKGIYSNLKVISSDEERYELLGINPSDKEETFKYSVEMKNVSEPAFHILKAKVEGYCKNNHQFILIDSTGTPDTIKMLEEIADRYGYNKVAFIMDLSLNELSKYALDKEISAKSIKLFKDKSLKNLKGWERLSISNREVMPLLIEESPIYLDNFSVIGDLHQRLEQLTKLQLEGTCIYIGDYFDPKPQFQVLNNEESVDKVLSFIENNPHHIYLKGNHENYIYYRLMGGKACDIENEYFSSVPILLNNDELKERFLKIYKRLMDYAKVISQGYLFHITHAPCSRKHRCKPNHPQNYKFKIDNEVDLKEQLDFLNDRAQVITISGHLTHNGDTLTPYKNRYLIDTSKSITALICRGNNIKSIRAGEYDKTYPSLLPSKHISQELEYKIQSLLDNNVRFISGTMSPSPSFNGKLESIEGALSYFKSKGIEDLVLDIKHMGSRCNAYISDEGVMLTSRKGNCIKDMEHIYPYLQSLRKSLNVKSLILDGELMPWCALGEDLVDEFEAKLWIYKQLESLGIFTPGLTETQKTLTNFSSKQEPYYIPFSILQMETHNRVITYPEWDMDTLDIKELIKADKGSYLAANVNDIEEINKFFQGVIDKGLEGIVIRPNKPKDKNKIPYMKVRGRDYLRLIYGPNYMEDEDKLAMKRNIKGKVDLSIEEWKLGKSLLSSDIGERKRLFIDMLGFIDKEVSIDPRL